MIPKHIQLFRVTVVFCVKRPPLPGPPEPPESQTPEELGEPLTSARCRG